MGFEKSRPAGNEGGILACVIAEYKPLIKGIFRTSFY